MKRSIVPTLLALGDGVVAILGLVFAVAIRERVLPGVVGLEPFAPVRSYVTLWPAVPLLILVRGAFGLYPGYGMHAAEELRIQSQATLLVTAFGLVGGVVFRYGEDYSRIVIALWLAGLLIALPIVRAGLKHLLSRSPFYGREVVVIGRGAQRSEIVELLATSPGLGLRPVAGASSPGGVQDCVVVPDDLNVPLSDLLDELNRRYRRVWLIPNLLNVSSVWVRPRDLRGHLALELRNNLLEPRNRFVKRALDVLLVVAATPLLLPLLLVIAAAVRLDSPGPVLYRQKRVGRKGDPIRIYKFRSMRRDADAVLARLLAEDPEARCEWEAFQKLRRDPRVTPVGRVLRATSLDELPQLWNVLRGDMSLVGPRPVLRDELRRYGPSSLHYLQLRPGLTGLVQVSGRSELDYDERVRIDAYYVRNWSVWLDLVILARTVVTVFMRRGAY